MSPTQTGALPPERLRLWPGVVALTAQWVLRFAVPLALPEAMAVGVIGSLLAGLAILVWWAFFSRSPRLERWGAVVLIVVAVLATRPILHPSLATGMMGMMFPIYATPVLSLALVGWAAVSRRFAYGPRRLLLVAAIAAACGLFALLRTDGITGEGDAQFAWRWTETSEQRLLALARSEPPAPPKQEAVPEPQVSRTKGKPAASVGTAVTSSAAWPGFRGPRRDGVITGVRLETDWTSSPPVELWRRPVGPGWSSFAVAGGLIYTQEQRGEFEVVACYRAATGDPVWAHRDAARFWESNGGAGPRGTPSIHQERVYSLGATGIVNALDAATGKVIWTRNAASDTGARIPGWGFSGSPLIAGDLVIVAASGRLAAYDRDTGHSRWNGPNAGGSYSSPHLVTIAGVPQVLLLSNSGAISVAPADGAVLWQHAWPGSAILQPAAMADGGLLITTGDMSGGMGTRRLAVAPGPGGWTAKEVWTSTGLKPYFNDFVVHNGHAFGFDGSILACIDLADGKRKWKGGRYGHGQMLLVRDQDLGLILSEEGELALVAAVPGQFTEIARFPALHGKTWNHPVLTGGVLLVRNDQEMVAFRLPLAGG